MPTARFCQLVGISERSYRRWQAKARAGHPPKGPWPAPVRLAHRQVIVAVAVQHPAWGDRKIWATARHSGHRISQSSVLRILDDAGLLLKADYQRERRQLAQARRPVTGRCRSRPAASSATALRSSAQASSPGRPSGPTGGRSSRRWCRRSRSSRPGCSPPSAAGPADVAPPNPIPRGRRRLSRRPRVQAGAGVNLACVRARRPSSARAKEGPGSGRPVPAAIDRSCARTRRTLRPSRRR